MRTLQTASAVLVATALFVLGGCSSGDSQPTAQDSRPTRAQLVRFCTAVRGLEGERPESYVGSAEHVRDLDALLAASPSELRASVRRYRDFIASGAVDPKVPESSLAENWPKPIRDAANAIQDYFHTKCSSEPSSGPEASTNAHDPKGVVAEFIAALNAHDADAAKRFLTARQAQQVTGAADSWLTNVKSITNVTIGQPTPDKRAGYQQAVKVPVEFDLDQRHASSLPNGHISWGYLLVRNSDSDPWLIDDQGVA